MIGGNLVRLVTKHCAAVNARISYLRFTSQLMRSPGSTVLMLMTCSHYNDNTSLE